MLCERVKVAQWRDCGARRPPSLSLSHVSLHRRSDSEVERGQTLFVYYEEENRHSSDTYLSSSSSSRNV